MVVSHPQQLTIIFGNLLLWEFTPGESRIRFVIVTDRWNVLTIGTWPLYTRQETKTSREDLVNKCQNFCLQLPWNLIYTVCTCSRDLDHTVMMTYIYITMKFVFVPQNITISSLKVIAVLLRNLFRIKLCLRSFSLYNEDVSGIENKQFCSGQCLLY